jgi:uncharacterized protein YgiM (DUF1202 family)
MRRTVVATLALLLALAGTTALAQETRWVITEGTTLKQEASISSPDVTPLPVGAELSVIESGGRWLKVRAGGKTGWVYTGRTSDTKPVAEVGGAESGLFGESMQQSKIQTAKADSARSIRGLSPEADQYAKQRGTPESYKKALDQILERKVSDKELKAFLRDGKIGEYAP